MESSNNFHHRTSSLDNKQLSQCPGCGSQKIFCFEKESDIYKCNNCTLYFVNPRPASSLFKNYYTIDYYANQSNKISIIERNRQRLFKIVPYKSSGQLLDVGCGNGIFLNLASKYFHVSGLDVAKASKEFIEKQFGINVKTGTIADYESNEKYDVITLHHVLEHVYDLNTTLIECKKLLKSDGYLVIAVPNNSFFLKRFIILFANSLSIKKLLYFSVLTNLSESHVNHFSNRSLNAVMNHNGFNCIKADIDPIYTKTSDTKITYYDIYFKICMLLKYLTGANFYYAIYNIYQKKKLIRIV